MKPLDELDELADSTRIYHERRYRLMRELIRRHNPLVELDADAYPYCEVCGATHPSADELHIHHPDGHPDDVDITRQQGGWQRVEIYLEEIERGVPMYVLCPLCHYLMHRAAGEDEDAGRLARRLAWLEEYSDVDPDFTLEQRRTDTP